LFDASANATFRADTMAVAFYNRTPKMHSPFNHSPLKPKGHSAKNILTPVVFTCHAPHAAAVFIAGDFNDRDPAALPLKQMPDGAWRAEVQLNHGHHHYLFIVDGKAMLDPRAPGIARNEKGEKVSLVAVS